MDAKELLKMVKTAIQNNEELAENLMDIEIDPNDSYNLYVSLANNGRYVNFAIRVDEF